MKILKMWKDFTSDERRIFVFCSISFFFCLGSYPAIRSLAQSLFLEHVGAEKIPYAWMITIFALAFVIALFNKLQKTYYVQRLHSLIGFVSLFLLGGSYLAMEAGQSWGAYSFFIWKEIYIVMLVGFTFSFCNNFYQENQAKLLYGPYGAIGAVGAVIGGQMTAYLSGQKMLGAVLIMGIAATLISSYLFSRTGKTLKMFKKEVEDTSPLVAIKDVKVYVFYMCLLVASTQFAINSATQMFYLLLEVDMPDKFKRTAYLGEVFSLINLISLLINLLIMPWLLNIVSTRVIQFFIPVLFLLCVSLFGGAHVPLILAGGFFVSFKAIDYSLFSVVKELLYFPLNKMQKFGAKYITDIFVYRSAKTLIAVLLVSFSSKDEIFLILVMSLILWLISVFALDRYQQKLKRNVEL